MNQVKVELYLNNLWEEVEAAIDTIEIQEIFHNKLKNADNNAKVQFAPNETLYNQLRYLLNNKIDVKARIKKDSTVVFTGYIRKTLGFEKTQKLERVKIELVSPSYLLKRKIPQRLLYRNQTVQAIVVDILSKAGVTDIQSFAIPNIVPILTTEEDKDAYFTVIETLLFEYGYVFDFDASGRFVVRSLNPSIPSSPFVFNETNLRNIVEQRKIEEEFEKVIIEWASLETVSSGVIFSDTSGARDGYKCLIEIPPGKYLGEKDDGTGKEWFPDLVHEKGNVLYYENPSLDLSADPGISVEKFLNESKILLSIKNTNQSVSQFIRKLDITASSIIIKPEGTNKTVVVRQEGTEKVLTYKSRFIFQKDVADNLANLLVNYYKYSDFVYSFHSKIEKAVGEIVSISEPGIGTNTVRIISKSYNPAEELYDYTAEAIDEYTSTTANTSTTVSGSVPWSYVDSIASKRLTVYLYQDAKIQPEKPSDTVTYNVTTNSFSGLTNGWTETQPNASRSPIWLISYTTIVSATQVMLEIEPDDWSNAVRIFIGTPLYLGLTSSVPTSGSFPDKIDGDWCLCTADGKFYKWTGSAWTDAGITTANKMAALQDLLAIADASDATAFCQTLVSVDAFIQNLMAKYLRLQNNGAIYSGGYDQYGNNPDNLPGVFINAGGTMMANQIYIKNSTVKESSVNINFAGTWLYGTWGSETAVNSAKIYYGSLAVLPDGRVLCVYIRYSDHYLVQRIRDTSGNWGSETVVSSTISYIPSLAVLPDGRVLCVYMRYPDYYLVQRIRDTSGTWGSETSVNSASSDLPSLAVLPDGRVLCVYTRYSDYYLVQRIRDTSGTWGSETEVNSANSAYPGLAVLPDGKVLCVYRRNSDGYLVQRLDTSYYSSIPIGSFPVQLGAGIIEVGENSNGVWIKWSDGTMICYKRIVETRSVTNPENNVNFGTTSGYMYVYNDPSPVRLFPQPFVDGSVPIVVSQNDKPQMMWVIPNSKLSGMITNTGFGVQFIHYMTNNTVFEGMFIAIGRWKQ